MYTASCLCQAVTFTITSPLTHARYCHCSKCRKFAGTAHASWAIVDWSSIELSADECSVNTFNSGGGLRSFCNQCGSPLWFRSLQDTHLVAIPLGVIDTGSVPKPNSHIWTSAMPKWSHIHDDLRQFTKNPE